MHAYRNKDDLGDTEQRAVTYEEGAALARESGCLFYETSAKSGHNVEACFVGTAKGVYAKIQARVLDIDDPRCGVRREAAESRASLDGGRQSLSAPKKAKKKDCC